MATLSFKNLCKVYDKGVKAVVDFNLEIADKEFIVFVGPSGCGKSTTLRMVAGLEDISSGELYIDDKLVNDVLPKNRDIAMVFQNYALYPHMNVYDNMAFSLKIKKVDKKEIDERVHYAAGILGLENYLDRKPKELSGGQMQRVALGRAIVRSPKVFLMDEPLSNLDAKLRVQMRSQISKIHERVGATTIYVTHDQVEAMTMADRIVIMKDGFVQQIGTPKEIYNNPVNTFVAGFIGSPSMNLISAKWQKGKIVFDNEHSIKTTKEIENKLKNYFKNLEEEKKVEDETVEEKKEQNNEFIFGIRPEDIFTSSSNISNPSLGIKLNAEVVELLGKDVNVYSTLNNSSVVMNAPANCSINEKDNIEIFFDFDKVHLFSNETGEVIK